MNRTFIVTVEVDEDQFNRLNDSRRRLNCQLHDPAGYAENAIVCALQCSAIPSVKVRELKLAQRSFRNASGDVHANA